MIQTKCDKCPRIKVSDEEEWSYKQGRDLCPSCTEEFDLLEMQLDKRNAEDIEWFFATK